MQNTGKLQPTNFDAESLQHTELVSKITTDPDFFWNLTAYERLSLISAYGAVGRFACSRYMLDFFERKNQLPELRDKMYLMALAKSVFDTASVGFLKDSSRVLELLIYHNFIKCEWLTSTNYRDWLKLALTSGYDTQVLTKLTKNLNLSFVDQEFLECNRFALTNDLAMAFKKRMEDFEANGDNLERKDADSSN